MRGRRGARHGAEPQKGAGRCQGGGRIDGGEKRLSWHALRHSAGSIWLTEYGLAITTVSAMMGHSNPAFTLACYGRDPRDEQAIVADVLERAAKAANSR